MTEYVIRGGKPGYDRLMLLARERWPDTRALLERAGISAGMHCIDLGCGGGEVTMEIARLVAPGGTVVGADMDEIKLALARQAAAERQLSNVEFRVLDVRDWDERAAYDAVYTRFLLQHLSQPADSSCSWTSTGGCCSTGAATTRWGAGCTADSWRRVSQVPGRRTRAHCGQRRGPDRP